MLAYLALQERPISRESLAALFWPENDQSNALAGLRRELARLKADVGQDLIYSDRHAIGIAESADLWVDVRAFSAEIDTQEPDRLAGALEYYTNEFMAGLTLPDCPGYDEWQFFLSEKLRESFADGLQRRLEAQANQSNFLGAIESARRWLSLDSLHEPAHRALMRLYALSAQYSAAIRQYHVCAKILETELGVEPDQETISLFEAIQDKAIGPKPSAEIDLTFEPGQAAKPPQRRHNIPQMQDAFIGRREEITTIHTYLTAADTRLVTLRGIGGIGKTRLAIQSIYELIETDFFPDGLFMVHLAGIERIDYIVPAIAEALRFPISESNDPLDQLINYLNSKKILLFLDNFEHLQRGAIQLSSLLQYCPHLKLLITSRQQLNLAGEYVLLIEGLGLSEKYQRQSSAVKLFEERACQLDPNLDVVAERPYIREICRLVGGMPLAIEMCAAWIQTINCQEILAEIEQGLDLLEGRQADMPERHQSIRVVFHSYFGLLRPEERETILMLANFRGSFNYAAAKHVAGASLMQLRSLVEKSLLSSYGTQAQTRYQIHPLLRQFSIEQIKAEKLAEMRRRHAQYFSELLFELDKKRCGAEIEQIVPTVFIEVDNLRSVWGWFGRLIAANEEIELVCRLLEQFLPAWSYAFWRETRFSEGKQLLNMVWQLMEKANWETAESPDKRWAFALMTDCLAQFCLELSQFKETVSLSKRALAIMRPLYKSNFRTDKRFLADTLRTWARADIRLGDYPDAREKLLESINTAPSGETKAWSIYTLAILYSNTGRYDKALAAYQDAMALFEACHDQGSILTTTSSIGSVYGRQRNFEKAIEYFEKVVALSRQMNQRVTMMIAMSNLAFCLRRVGRINRVGRYFEEALEVAKELGAQRWQAVISQDFGKFLLEQGDVILAKQHLQLGLSLSLSINSEPDALAGLLSMAEYQAQIGRFEEALTAAGFVMNNDIATEENRSYAADFWDELSSELPPIFTTRAKAKLKNATFDDILAMMPSP